MSNTNNPSNNDLPSLGKLIMSTILAICLAAIILVTVVLPAEYGIDPLGFGELIGLTKMGQIKVSLAREAAIEAEPMAGGDTLAQEQRDAEVAREPETTNSRAASREDRITFTLEPDEGTEVKLTMAKGSMVKYLWYTNGGKANFDAHADSKKLDIKYHNYEKGQLEKSEGTMEAVFDGNHGWFWRNRTSAVLTVTLEISGEYTDVLRF